jgi:hypothetical protein
MKKFFFACVPTLVSLAILLIPTLSIPVTIEAQEDATILIYSDPRPGYTGSGGETDLSEDFNATNNIGIIPNGWTLDCVQNSGDVDPISTGYYTLDNAYATSELASLPHFMCVGNHEAETSQDMIDIRAKFSGYPDWNLIAGPEGTSETTYSYDVGDIHVVVINEYWNGADNDACLNGNFALS